MLLLEEQTRGFYILSYNKEHRTDHEYTKINATLLAHNPIDEITE